MSNRKGAGAVGAFRRWLLANPGEYLAYEDLVTMFGFKTVASAKQAIYVLKMEGLVRSERVVYADPERPRC